MNIYCFLFGMLGFAVSEFFHHREADRNSLTEFARAREMKRFWFGVLIPWGLVVGIFAALFSAEPESFLFPIRSDNVKVVEAVRATFFGITFIPFVRKVREGTIKGPRIESIKIDRNRFNWIALNKWFLSR